MSVPSNNGACRADFIAELCRKRKIAKHPEIVVQTGSDLSEPKIGRAVGVDPGAGLSAVPTRLEEGLSLLQPTSDAFFVNCDNRMITGGRPILANCESSAYFRIRIGIRVGAGEHV